MSGHPETFICYECWRCVPWHDEEKALAELAIEFPGLAPGDPNCIMVCDDCYSRIKPVPTC